MGNCQASDAAKVVIQQADGRVQRLYWSTSAGEIMRSNPDHYVAVVTRYISGDPGGSSTGAGGSLRVTRLRILKQKDILIVGQVFRMVTQQEVRKALQAWKQGRMRKAQAEMMKRQHKNRLQRSARGRRRSSHQWHPSLQSISELEADGSFKMSSKTQNGKQLHTSMSRKDSKTTGGNGQSVRLPRKRFYRARAHSNPLSDSHFPIPISPSDIDYSHHYPRFFDSKHDEHDKGVMCLPKVRFADIGCGFGGLLVKLSPLFPETLMIGMELRDKVTEYVKERILALRASNPGQYDNISVVRTNSMKYLPNYFCKGQLSKMFFLFPDPHFKEKNHRRRVISPQLLDEYAFALEVGGIIYTITDVEELEIG
ncbi:hypothetical protein HPP92_010364 [Vanilla planifolia]|uniref:tRNA (guanine-N(7)-)-methyltransferase n=1 Tax=Vanilla planifolia TaxID=51239 RepID=A0A835R6B5_VANPL|nr:hypothetical protein HPP92_010585 [Vanilla planifolia]KAG0482280.1 hypothetical protein HPP92_010364 [Vanilla planifolia]